VLIGDLETKIKGHPLESVVASLFRGNGGDIFPDLID
jgi:hypothetical protein